MKLFTLFSKLPKGNSNKKKIKILGTGKYVPQKVLMTDIEKKYNIPEGWTEKHSGVISKHWVTTESIAYMGAEALKQALQNSNCSFSDLDLIISAGASFDYPIPHQAPLIKNALNQFGTTTPAISINSTCLSFVTSLDIASSLLDGKRYKKIAIISSEISSKNLNSKEFETFTLFGDGAAAAIVEYSKDKNSYLLGADMITIESEVHQTMVRGGGAAFHPKDNPYEEELYAFRMNGKALIKVTSETAKGFLQNLFKKASLHPSKLNWIIPHQASKLGLLVFKKLYPHLWDKTFMNLETHGNCIAASIPMALHDAIQEGKIKRGDIIMLAGTSAGFSIGGVILKY